MPSSCPKCHRVLEEDEICCAQLRYTWRCKSCFKLTSEPIVPYGKCYLCAGELEVIADRDLGDGLVHGAIHDAIEFELRVYHFYRRVRERAAAPEQRIVLEHLCENGLDHLQELEENYHVHLDHETAEHALDDETLSADWAFHGIHVEENASIEELYQVALEVERRARDHFRLLATQFPAGLENDLCREMAAEQEEHLAMLETEVAQPATLRPSSTG